MRALERLEGAGVARIAIERGAPGADRTGVVAGLLARAAEAELERDRGVRIDGDLDAAREHLGELRVHAGLRVEVVEPLERVGVARIGFERDPVGALGAFDIAHLFLEDAPEAQEQRAADRRLGDGL